MKLIVQVVFLWMVITLWQLWQLHVSEVPWSFSFLLQCSLGTIGLCCNPLSYYATMFGSANILYMQEIGSFILIVHAMIVSPMILKQGGPWYSMFKGIA